MSGPLDAHDSAARAWSLALARGRPGSARWSGELGDPPYLARNLSLSAADNGEVDVLACCFTRFNLPVIPLHDAASRSGIWR